MRESVPARLAKVDKEQKHPQVGIALNRGCCVHQPGMWEWAYLDKESPGRHRLLPTADTTSAPFDLGPPKRNNEDSFHGAGAAPPMSFWVSMRSAPLCELHQRWRRRCCLGSGVCAGGALGLRCPPPRPRQTPAGCPPGGAGVCDRPFLAAPFATISTASVAGRLRSGRRPPKLTTVSPRRPRPPRPLASGKRRSQAPARSLHCPPSPPGIRRGHRRWTSPSFMLLLHARESAPLLSSRPPRRVARASRPRTDPKPQPAGAAAGRARRGRRRRTGTVDPTAPAPRARERVCGNGFRPQILACRLARQRPRDRTPVQRRLVATTKTETDLCWRRCGDAGWGLNVIRLLMW